ncbi:mannose-1-phosphate guanylyltransferase [Algoriphagus sediminis]|uniref:Mannose-1-phosphate guanylyltransferase n=1 Tax=Algoriphagus sediminis TaxID=3057113 RepID=A0ABT7Y9V4_9BACT|nr:mannose-1-phosphate guanylyltransferase [Algoriphagus sediminis]MDN3203288.1 mannose-1-phosphate guanylyltransferase [Algoriphagus sediminis]
MANRKKTYIVIMAGGIGARFWPYSRRHKPKQFLDVLGEGRSLLQMTFDRFKEMASPDRFIVITYGKYLDQVKEQLPELDENQILCEPSRKNTATCIAYATYRIYSKDPDASLIITPADHLILEGEKFHQVMHKALRASQHGQRLVTIGIKPTRPETGYGYIQYVQEKNFDVLKVKTFTEKPDLELAKTFLKSGDFLWNSGIFIWKAESLISALKTYLPDTAEVFEDGLNSLNTSKEAEFIRNAYALVKNISIDFGVMEKSDQVYVIPADIGWSDLGSWQSLHDIRTKDPDGNVIDGNTILYDTKGSFIRLDNDKLVMVKGLENYLIVEENNVLLICPIDSEKEFRQFVADAKKKDSRYI